MNRLIKYVVGSVTKTSKISVIEIKTEHFFNSVVFQLCKKFLKKKTFHFAFSIPKREILSEVSNYLASYILSILNLSSATSKQN